MKKTFIAILLFYLTIHTFARILMFEFKPHFYTIPDFNVATKAFWLNFRPIFTSIIIVYFIAGGFRAILAGSTNGSIVGYLNIFFNFSTVFAILITIQKKKYNFLFITIASGFTSLLQNFTMAQLRACSFSLGRLLGIVKGAACICLRRDITILLK